MSWFRKNRESGGSDEEAPTGQLPAVKIDEIVAEVDGTEQVDGASKSDVEAASVSAEPGRDEPDDDLDRALADRQTLIQLCLYALDRARSGGVGERIEQGLAGIGVQALRPDGQRFDPGVHEAGGAVPTTDPTLSGTVAETETVGFRDGEHLLRAPIVTVYTHRTN